MPINMPVAWLNLKTGKMEFAIGVNNGCIKTLNARLSLNACSHGNINQKKANKRSKSFTNILSRK